MNSKPLISNAFETFFKKAPEHAGVWMETVKGLDHACALDKKTEALAYLAVLAALRLESGIPFHVQSAKTAGASKEEVISAILIGLPAAGNAVIQALPAAIETFESECQ